MLYELRNLVLNLFRKGSVYLISDTHFDHNNIIRYCHRPFRSVSEMNDLIISNWNNTVNQNDIVYFLGDWGFGKGSRPASYWRKRLNGKILSIKGSHDKKGRKYRILKNKKHTFLLIHDPNDARRWKGWIIHGHVHNNKMDKYPFINGYRKTINVGVELTGYTPINLDILEALNIDSIKWMTTSNSSPERW